MMIAAVDVERTDAHRLQRHHPAEGDQGGLRGAAPDVDGHDVGHRLVDRQPRGEFMAAAIGCSMSWASVTALPRTPRSPLASLLW